MLLYYLDQSDAVEWNDTNTRIICSLFDKQVKEGNRPNTHLNSVGYDEVAESFYQMTGIHVTKLQLKNKWDKLKPGLVAWQKNIEGNQIGAKCRWWDYNGCRVVEEDKEGDNLNFIFL